MKRRLSTSFGWLCGFLIAAGVPGGATAEPPAAATAAFNTYVGTVEARLAQQHRSPKGFLAPAAGDPQRDARLRRGELVVEKMTPETGPELSGAMLHHWRGTAFAPGATTADFEGLMRNFGAYPKYFAPEVLQGKVTAEQGNRLQASMRVRQKHIITVVMDTAYDVTYGALDATHHSSISRTTRIDEIEAPGTSTERALGPSEEHGLMWRLNVYWSYEERDGGLYMQIETVTLSRSIPRGLGWMVGPFVESVPRESLEFTLRSTCNALKK